MELAHALAKFNRKERYWLLHNALGEGFHKLKGSLVGDLENLLGIRVPESAWWAMDYHIDWLVGALQLIQDKGDTTRVHPNDHALVKGNQEDIDLILAFGNTLVLIEAKGDTSWSNSQLGSKIDRLEAIFASAGGGLINGLSIHYVLMSPCESKNLKREKEGKALDWPTWMTHHTGEKIGQPLWIELAMAEGNQTPAFLKVARCDDTGSIGKAGGFWKTTPY